MEGTPAPLLCVLLFLSCHLPWGLVIRRRVAAHTHLPLSASSDSFSRFPHDGLLLTCALLLFLVIAFVAKKMLLQLHLPLDVGTSTASVMSRHSRKCYGNVGRDQQTTPPDSRSMAIFGTFTSITTVKICTTSGSRPSLDSAGEGVSENAPQYVAGPPVTSSVMETLEASQIVSRSQKVFAKIITDVENVPSLKATLPGEMTTPVTTPADTVVSDPFSPVSDTSTSASSATATPVKPLKSILKNGPKSLEAAVETDSEDSDDELSDSDESSDEDGLEAGHDEDDDFFEDDQSEEDESDEEFDSDDDYYDDYDDYEDDNEDLNISFSMVSFGNSVHFCEQVEIFSIESRHTNPNSRDTMTAHERMLMHRDTMPLGLNDRSCNPDEHGRDTIDVDQSLLVAHFNGLKTLAIKDTRAVICARASRPGLKLDKDFLSRENIDPINEYLNRIEETVLGMFPYLFTDDEYRALLGELKLSVSMPGRGPLTFHPEYEGIRGKISRLLEEKLAVDLDFFGPEMGVWLGLELLEPLARRAHRVL